MDIKTLNYFLTVANEGTFSGAAKKLYIAQPPLSRQIQKLEKELGVTLFIRGKRRVRLTEEGSFLKQRAEEIITLVEKTESQMGKIQSGTHGMISIGVTETCGASVLPDILEKFHREYPLIRYNIWSANGDEINEKLDKGLVDIGIVREPFNIDKYDSTFLKTEAWVAVLSKKNLLARQAEDTIELSKLTEEPLFIPSRLPLQYEINHWFDETLQEYNIICLYNALASVIPLVEKNMGIAIAPEAVKCFTNGRRLSYKKIVGPEHLSRIMVIRRRGQMMPAATNCFWDFIQNELKMQSLPL